MLIQRMAGRLLEKENVPFFHSLSSPACGSNSQRYAGVFVEAWLHAHPTYGGTSIEKENVPFFVDFLFQGF